MLKKFNPTTPSLRHTHLSGNAELTKKPQVARIGKRIDYIMRDGVKVARTILRAVKPEKSLLSKLHSTGGRNNVGRITTRHCGGGHKRKYRLVDFKRDKFDVVAIVDSIQYDPNRSAHIALLHYADTEKRYIIAPKNLKAGDEVISYGDGKGLKEDLRPGVTMRLSEMRVGTTIHNIEIKPGRGGALIRSAGTSGQFSGVDNDHAIVKLNTGEVRRVPAHCRATVGIVSNAEHNLQQIGKAGRKRWLGIRPTVRGVAMNPVDHPHGGGEGRTKGIQMMSPTSVYAKGFKTRHKKKSLKHIVQRRKKK